MPSQVSNSNPDYNNLSADNFENLLAEFCKQDLPEGFNIEVKREVLGNESGVLREIDVELTGRVGMLSLFICGEAKNWSDPVDIQVIDAALGKYKMGEVRADKVFLFSKNGYSAAAKERALLNKFELLQPETLGKPIVLLAHMLGYAEIKYRDFKVFSRTKQDIKISVEPKDYTIIVEGNRYSCFDFFFKKILESYRRDIHKVATAFPDILTIEQANVQYEIAQAPGERYIANFEVSFETGWTILYSTLPTGRILHINKNEVRNVHLNGLKHSEIADSIRNSPTVVQFLSEAQIEEKLKATGGFCFFLRYLAKHNDNGDTVLYFLE